MRPDRPRPLRAVLTICAGFWLAVAGSVAGQAADVTGTWEGFLDINAGQGLTVVIHVSQGSGGALTGTMDSPDQNAFGMAVSDIDFTNGILSVVIASVPGEPTFIGVLSEDGGTLDGTFTQGPGSLPLVLTKQEGPA